MFEECRTDPFGRRVLVRLRCKAAGTTDPNCKRFIERTVWDGDQSLYELRAKGAAADSAYFEAEADTGAFRGWLAYVHGRAIDQPLVVYRKDGRGTEGQWVGVVPLPNWRGNYELGLVATGTYAGQTAAQCPGGQYGSGCPLITWPGAAVRLEGDKLDKWSSPPVTWTGNLLSGRSDGSGLQYRRNRYYDPGSGRFTQADPIGLAGGLNAYGFAGGDAINFVDPMGTCAEESEGDGDSTRTKKRVTATYCSDRGTLQLSDSTGAMVEEIPAGDTTVNPKGNPFEMGSNGPAPTGTYPVQPAIVKPQNPDAFGPAFYPVGKCGAAACAGAGAGDIARQRGIGIHGGRKGPSSPTHGCIRVSNSDVARMAGSYRITSITIGCP